MMGFLKPNELTSLRSPVSVNLEITERCNLGCTFCFNAEPDYEAFMNDASAQKKLSEQNIARLNKLKQIVNNLKESGVLEVRFFGGEFGVFKPWRELMKYVSDLGFFISFVSNGTVFKKDDFKFLRDCGVRECTISIHGTEEQHDSVVMQRGAFQKAMSSIKSLSDLGISVSVTYTPTKETLGGVSDFVRDLHGNHGVSNFGVNRLFSSDRYQSITLDEYQDLLANIDRLSTELAINIMFLDSFPRCKVPMKYWKYLGYCSQGVGFAQIDFRGNTKHCSAITHSVGNVLMQPLEEIWDKPLSDYRALKHLPLSCKVCPVFCGGGCTASRGVNSQFNSDEFMELAGTQRVGKAYRQAVWNLVRRSLYNLQSYFNRISSASLGALQEASLGEREFRLRKVNWRAELDGSHTMMIENIGTMHCSKSDVDEYLNLKQRYFSEAPTVEKKPEGVNEIFIEAIRPSRPSQNSKLFLEKDSDVPAGYHSLGG